MAKISRRDFLKGTAAGAVGIAALGFAPGVEHAKAEEKPQLTAQQAVAKLNPQDYDFRSKDTDMAAIFSDWKFGGLTLHHRMVKSAAGSDTAGNPQELIAYYEAFAKGGVEMVWVEDFLQLYAHYVNPRKKDPATQPLAELVKAVHDAGGYIGYQLSCMGQKFSGFDPATAAQYQSACAEHLTLEELKNLQSDFIEAAAFLQSAGFDAVEINAAGNNIGQAFFSRMRNHRDDEYGPQSFENRARFVAEIVSGIKEKCGRDFPVQILINAIEENDVNIGDSTLFTTVEENCEIAKMLEAAGADFTIACLHMGREGYYEPTDVQTELCRYTVDAGFNAVYCTHTHRLQPAESYNGGVIFYGLGNFIFGGHTNPGNGTDPGAYDTGIAQLTLKRVGGEVTLDSYNFIPCSLSSTVGPDSTVLGPNTLNNYQPQPYTEGGDAWSRAMSMLNGTYEGANYQVDYGNVLSAMNG